MKFILFIILLSVLTLKVTSERDLCEKFSWFLRKNNITYNNETDASEAQEYYQQNCQLIIQHRELYEIGAVSYILKPMPFIDQDLEVVKSKLCGLNVPPTARALPAPRGNFYPAAPRVKNWCYLHMSVRDQQQCGSCWAFSTVAVVEALINRVRGTKVNLSEQMLIDCNTENGGCNGGWPTDALNYVKKNGISEASYSYVNTETQCSIKKYKKGLNVNGIQKVTEEYVDGDEEKMARILNAKGPLVGAMHINNDILSYGGGVYIDDTCSKTEINHAVVICGYGVCPTYGPYWIVRNSWSEVWGEQGYIRIARGRNTCGIGNYAMFAEL